MELNESILTLLEKTNPGAFAIMSVTAEGIKLRYVSEEAAKIVGMTQEECLEAGGKDALRMVVQEERQRITALADQCLRDREDMDAIYHVRHKTKGVTLIRTKGRMIGSIDGEAYLYVAVTDIAGEKETSLNCCPQDNTDIKLDQQRYTDFFRSLNQAYPDNLGSFRLNLTKNICVHGSSPLDFVMKQKESGTVDGYFHEFSKLIADQDRLDWFHKEFTREALIQRFYEGETRVEFPYSIRYADGVRWRRAILIMQENPFTDDIEAVTYAIDIDLQERGKMILQLMTSEGSDYIGFVDVASETYAMHSGSWNGKGMQSGQRAPYKDCLAKIEKYCASPKSQKKFVQQASLKNLVKVLEKSTKYTLAYDFVDGKGQVLRKQVDFQWFDKQKSEILVIQSDVTVMWNEEQERLHRMEEMESLRDTVSNVPMGIMVFSIGKTGTLLVAENEHVQQILGSDFQTEEDFLKKIHPDNAKEVQAILEDNKEAVIEFQPESVKLTD